MSNVEYLGGGDWKKARKEYKCYKCGTAIHAGDRYWANFSCADDIFHPDHYCAECAIEVQEMPDYLTWPRQTKLVAWTLPYGKKA